MEEYKRYLELAEDKTVITLLQKLLDDNLLEFITEYPSVQYTKEMVKLETYVIQYMQTYNIQPYKDTDGNIVLDQEDVQVIKTMCKEFMLKMTSHKRRRAQEIVNGASRQESTNTVISEHKGLKRFLGLK